MTIFEHLAHNNGQSVQSIALPSQRRLRSRSQDLLVGGVCGTASGRARKWASILLKRQQRDAREDTT